MLAVALDIGDAHATCAVVRDEALLARDRMRVEPVNFRRLLPHLETFIRKVVANPSVELRECCGIVFGFPGIVDSRQRVVVAADEKFDDAVELDLPGCVGLRCSDSSFFSKMTRVWRCWVSGIVARRRAWTTRY